MNLLFFRRKKEQTTSLSSAADTVAPQKHSSAAPTSQASKPANSASAADTGFLEIPLESLLPFLPETAVRHGRTIEPNRLIRLPLNQVLPQLSRGRVVTPLGDVLSQLPAEMVTVQMPYTGSDKMVLPLEHVVAHLSPETLCPRNDQREIELNDADIPAPFVESPIAAEWSQDQAPTPVETPSELSNTLRFADSPKSVDRITDEPQAQGLRLPENLDETPLFEPRSTRDVQPEPQEPVAPKQTTTPSWRGQWVYVAVSDIVHAIPEKYLLENRESLQAQVDPTRKVPIAIEDVVSQLAKGRITLRLGKLKEMLPEGFLVPDVTGGELTIGIDKVIDQLPEVAFTQGLEQQDSWKDLEAIPTPFREKAEGETVAEEKTDQVAGTEPHPQDQAVAPKKDLISMPVEVQQSVASVLLAEVNRIEPLFVEQSNQPQTTASIVPAVKTVALVTESVGPPVEEKQPEAIKTPRVEATQETPIVQEAPALNEPVREDSPVVYEMDAPDPKAGAESDLDSITLSPESPDKTQPAVANVPREKIAETLNNLNTWSEEELHNHNLGPTLTQRILEWRQHRGGFKDLRELMQIAGIGPKLFERVLGFAPEALEDQTRAINRVLGVSEDHEMTLQEIVKCASKLQGVEGCIVAMGDGIYMTGELPKHLDTQRVSAFAPQLFARVGQYVRELNVGTARRFTIFTDAQPITIFKAGDMFFIVIHKANRFSKVLLNRCERISQEISHLCSKDSANR
ncbi:MAG: hypothetical protein EXS18_06095 [Verrucomicrobiae bacterium]|nr:hypothetical protein [Verrucomicrobiae bacterium]